MAGIQPSHVLLFFAAYARGQDTTASTPTTMSSTISSTSSAAVPTMPSASDSAPGGVSGSTTNPDGGKGYINYYFVFLALIVCVAALGAFFIWRRKRRMGALLRNSRDNSLARDLSTWDPVRARRRYWQGRWRSAEVSREEGLNEHGEAPPPYVPKTQDEELAGSNPHGPAVPLQTLSREQAGLKPPDYTEANVQPVNPEGRSSSAGAESSTRPTETRPTA